ncbi:hypothetical protein M0802_003329 [Mischocyttarus mexicanus]|nr:hypothetical protein M0802_003329 [Mischocyttarus mexicanus]
MVDTVETANSRRIIANEINPHQRENRHEDRNHGRPVSETLAETRRVTQ